MSYLQLTAAETSVLQHTENLQNAQYKLGIARAHGDKHAIMIWESEVKRYLSFIHNARQQVKADRAARDRQWRPAALRF